MDAVLDPFPIAVVQFFNLREEVNLSTEDKWLNLSTEDKMAGPKESFIRRFHW